MQRQPRTRDLQQEHHNHQQCIERHSIHLPYILIKDITEHKNAPIAHPRAWATNSDSDSTIQTRGTKYASHAPDCLTGRQISVISEKIVRRRPAERSLEDSSRVTSLYYHYGGQRDGAPASSIWLQINDRRVCQVTKN
jgi:hypothetical protein